MFKNIAIAIINKNASRKISKAVGRKIVRTPWKTTMGTINCPQILRKPRNQGWYLILLKLFRFTECPSQQKKLYLLYIPLGQLILQNK
jgi:hypothetical protein